MKIAVYGLGSIGQRHARNLLTLGHEVRGVDIMAGRREQLGIPEIQGDEDAAVIATPAASHHLQLCPKPHFVEKPITDSFADAFGAFRCREHPRALIQVGYQFRFEDGMREFRRRVAETRQREEILGVRVEFGFDVHRWGGAPATYLESGILLEASHELDLIRWVIGDPVTVRSAWLGKWHGLFEWREETAIALLFAQGIPVELHLDMTRPGYRRRFEVVGSRTEHTWEFDPQGDVNAMYLEEMRAFIAGVERGTLHPDAATFDDGIRALEIVEDIREVARGGTA